MRSSRLPLLPRDRSVRSPLARPDTTATTIASDRSPRVVVRRRAAGGDAAVVASAALLFLLLPVRADAQRGAGEREPRRPKFTVVRDTNSAGAYYYHGLSVLDRDPQQAADAFYWASRLDPEWADP